MRPRPRLARAPLFARRTAGPRRPRLRKPGEKSGSRQWSRACGTSFWAKPRRLATTARAPAASLRPAGAPATRRHRLSPDTDNAICRGAAPVEHVERHPSRLITEPTSWLCIVPQPGGREMTPNVAGPAKRGVFAGLLPALMYACSAKAQTCTGNADSTLDVICSGGLVLIADAATAAGSDADTCCECPHGTTGICAFTVQPRLLSSSASRPMLTQGRFALVLWWADRDEALGFRFRSSGITTDADGSLLWNAEEPTGLAFFMTRLDDCDLCYAQEQFDGFWDGERVTSSCRAR
eukprot:COSAG06_NODE_11632_length_1483_cov_1.508671_1_plen_293_part_10